MNSVAAEYDLSAAAEELRQRFADSKFRPIRRQSELPDILVQNFSGFGPNEIAGIGEEYNRTDVIDGGLPSRQIEEGGTAETVSYVVVNQGGIGTYRFTILVGELFETVVMCRFYFRSSPFEKVEDLRHLFENGEFAAKPACVVSGQLPAAGE